MRASQPKPPAGGKHRRRAAGDRVRCPESGSRKSCPLRASQRRGRPLDDPEPAFGARTPRPRDRLSVRRGGRRSRREVGVAQQQGGPERRLALAERQRLSLATAGSRTTRAPAASARAAVASVEPSSATRISASGNDSRRPATVAPIHPSSSRAATSTVSRSATATRRRDDDRRDGRQEAARRRRLDPVVA